ncbi:hypothetical protein PR048_019997 [Dryococelus australis]|uniref:DNA/RNA-binding protein Alba-like domain-containing protein n=1 Tax=Dryococelus australis TaxID=614101 RepID=A0ABQ9H522_9NEOP|nr:hypothetical protein PR048_019997 [Dryococelus australis]
MHCGCDSHSADCVQVTGGSKMRNVLGYALKVFKNETNIVWSGSGPAVGKTVSCVEIMKRRFKNVHQITKICYRKYALPLC